MIPHHLGAVMASRRPLIDDLAEHQELVISEGS
jgi:hypothetical protein